MRGGDLAEDLRMGRSKLRSSGPLSWNDLDSKEMAKRAKVFAQLQSQGLNVVGKKTCKSGYRLSKNKRCIKSVAKRRSAPKRASTKRRSTKRKSSRRKRASTKRRSTKRKSSRRKRASTKRRSTKRKSSRRKRASTKRR